jgi:hypothetical protein
MLGLLSGRCFGCCEFVNEFETKTSQIFFWIWSEVNVVWPIPTLLHRGLVLKNDLHHDNMLRCLFLISCVMFCPGQMYVYPWRLFFKKNIWLSVTKACKQAKISITYLFAYLACRQKWYYNISQQYILHSTKSDEDPFILKGANV